MKAKIFAILAVLLVLVCFAIGCRPDDKNSDTSTNTSTSTQVATDGAIG